MQLVENTTITAGSELKELTKKGLKKNINYSEVSAFEEQKRRKMKPEKDLTR